MRDKIARSCSECFNSMWKLLYQLASPRSFYNFSQRYASLIGAIAVLFVVVASVWGLAFAPADYQQGDAFRIIYVHVPAAFLSMLLYAILSFCALLYLVWRIKLAGYMLGALAKVGASMAFLALVTGSIWGKPMWGAWWVWDARLTSELILLLLYIAILAMLTSLGGRVRGDKTAAVVILVGFIDLPVIHYSVIWWNTLHQGSTLTVFAKPKIATVMLYPLLVMIAGFVFFSTWLILQQVSNEVLLRERKQRWVGRVVSNLCSK